MPETKTVISIIDDDYSVRKSLKRLIRSMGLTAYSFASAAEFLSKGHLHDSDCVIIDVCMPGMDGLDLQKHLSATGFSVPVIFITAHENEDARTQAMQAGALAFLKKPFTDQLLLDVIQLAVEQGNKRPSGNIETSGQVQHFASRVTK
jgi:FixJ family two-component response regulator